MKVVSKPLSGQHLRDGETGLAIRHWREEHEAPADNAKEHGRGSPCRQETLRAEPFAHWAVTGNGCGADLLRGLSVGGQLFAVVVKVRRLHAEYKLDEGASDERRSKMSREVMVQKELAAHDEERHVMRSPSQEEKACRVVKA